MPDAETQEATLAKETMMIQKNLPEALNNMGYYYAHGIIVKQDLEKATTLLHKAASLNSGMAYNNLGNIYSAKEFTKTPDWSKAADCFYKGAELNCPEAIYNYSLCLKSAFLKLTALCNTETACYGGLAVLCIQVTVCLFKSGRIKTAACHGGILDLVNINGHFFRFVCYHEGF